MTELEKQQEIDMYDNPEDRLKVIKMFEEFEVYSQTDDDEYRKVTFETL